MKTGTTKSNVMAALKKKATGKGKPMPKFTKTPFRVKK
jgi:hypothetical protein